MNTIIDLVGNTPLLRLGNMVSDGDANIFFKCESANPSGSIKDRPARYLVEAAERRGLLKPGGTIIESSSGNFGISLAMIGAVKGYRVIVLVDPKVTATNYAILKAYGAEVIVVREKDDCGSYHKTRIALANRLHREIPGSFRPDQCFNVENIEAHHRHTAREIDARFDGGPDLVIVPVSTGGQIGGIAKYLSETRPEARVIAVDAVGSTIFGGMAHGYLLPGMGLGWTPPNITDLSHIDAVYKVPDEDAFVMCRGLARNEGILAGGSTGAVALVALKYARLLGAGRDIVCIASDGGERYLATIFDDAYMTEHGFPLEESVAEIRERAGRLVSYSDHPIETANYKPGLATALGSVYGG